MINSLAETHQLDNVLYELRPGLLCIVKIDALPDDVPYLLSRLEKIAIDNGCWAITAELDISDVAIDAVRSFGLKDIYFQMSKKL